MYPNPYPPRNAAAAPSYAKQIQYVKDFLKRPITYITACLLSVELLLTAVSAITQREAVSPVITEGINGNILSISMVFGLVLTGVLVLGAWLTCLKSSNRSPLSTPATGLTILNVLSIVYIVMLGMALVIMIFAVLIAATAAGSPGTYNYYGQPAYDNPAMLATLVVLEIFILLVCFAAALCYYIMVLRFTSSLKRSLKSPLLKSGGSLPFAVFSIISTVVYLLGLIFVIPISVSNDPDLAVLKSNFNLNWLLVAQYILLLAVQICFAILGLSYRSYAERANAEITASMNPYPQGYPGFPASAQPPSYTPYAGQAAFPPYPTQRAYGTASPPEYANPYRGNNPPPQAPKETEPLKICLVCGAPVTDPCDTSCAGCGYKF